MSLYDQLIPSRQRWNPVCNVYVLFKDVLMRQTKSCALWYYESGNVLSWSYSTKLCLRPAVS